MTERTYPKVIIVGIDGCTFNVLNKLIAKNKLPNFSKLIQEGAYGKLRSTMPPGSPAAWSTFQTGKDPGKHGIFDFFRNNPENYNYTPVNATFLKEETFWMRLSRLGMRVGVVNFLFTYPPQPVNGFLVTGKETPSEMTSYTYPEQLKDEILEMEPAFEVEPFKRVTHTKDFLIDTITKLAIQEKVNRHLMEHHPTDMFMNMFAMPDILQHVFWRHMDDAHPLYDAKEAKIYAPLIEAIFQKLDEIIGNRLQGMGTDATIIVLSDHGACGLTKIVQINKWLQDHQLLFLRKRKFSLNSLLSFTLHLIKKVDRLFSGFDRLGLRRFIKHSTKEMRKNFSMNNLIDWSRTKAYMGRISESGIFCNLKGREKFGIVAPGDEYEAIRDEIINGLKILKDPETDAHIFRNVSKREDLYHGAYVKYAPDIIIETGDLPYQEGDNLLARHLFEKLTNLNLTGKHHPDGVLMVFGKGIKKGHVLNNIHIRDMAPTVLFMLGQKIPADMDGNVITEIFEDDIVKHRPIEFENELNAASEQQEVLFNDEEKSEIEKRLKDLGYL